jgi:ribosomal-protein-serine acetyltransferase
VDRTRLRLLEESDAQELSALIDENRAYLSRWMPWAAAQCLEDTRQFIQRARRQLADNDGFQTGVLVERQLIGVVGFHAVDWPNRATSIGYWLAERHQGKGTMTRAVQVLVDHALNDWRLNRVEVRVAPENVRSRALVQRLGFSEEGVLHEAELVGERYLDSVVYAMLAADWASRANLAGLTER